MKTNITTLFTGLVALGTLGACSTTSQLGQSQLGDVDPMYAQYRTPVAAPIALNETVTADYSKGNYQFQDESLSSKTVNPDLVAQYQNADQRADEGSVNDEYYVEDYNRPGAYGNQPQVVNNFYGNPNRFSNFGNQLYGGGFYDPFMDPFNPFNDPFYNSFAFGSPWAQPWGRPGFNMGLSFGWGMGGFGRGGWGSPFGFNRFNRFDRFGGYGGFYDPFWGPSMAYGGGWGRGFGGWGGAGGFYGRPNVLIINNESLANRRPTMLSRSSGVSNNRARVNSANDSRRSSTSRASRATTTSGRNAYDSRNTRGSYSSRNSTSGLTRSRNEAYTTADSRNNTSAQRSRTRSSNNYTASPSRSASPNNYQRSSGRNSTYSAPSSRSRSGSRGYSTPSRSSRSYGNSRSSGYSSSPSRSSSSSRSSGSYSSGSSSRSSGSSYSRSSSGSSRSSGSSSRSRSPR